MERFRVRRGFRTYRPLGKSTRLPRYQTWQSRVFALAAWVAPTANRSPSQSSAIGYWLSAIREATHMLVEFKENTSSFEKRAL
jgi:hypothetical protein